MHAQWTTPNPPFPSSYFNLPLQQPSQDAINQPVAGPSAPPPPSPPTGSGSHATSPDCSLCETGPIKQPATGVAFCCEEPECAPEEVCGPACPSTSFVGWDEMLLDDCKECVGADGSAAALTAAMGDPCCWPPVSPNASFDSFAACCTENCFDLPELAMGTASGNMGGPGMLKDDCPDCWGGPPSVSGSREDELTESGSSVATPADQSMLTTSPKGLAALMKGLDEKAIQEILNCCCCVPELQHNPTGWSPSQHASHLDVPQHVHFPPPSNQLVFHPYDAAASLSHQLAPSPLQQGSPSPFPNFRLPSLPQLQAQLPFSCGWQGCSLAFENKDRLVSHVNTAHLSVPAPPSSHSAFDLAALGLKLDAGLVATPHGGWDLSSAPSLTSGQTTPASLATPDPSQASSSTPVADLTGDKLAAATSTLQHLLQQHLSKLDPNVAQALTSSLAGAAKDGSSHSHPHQHSHHSHSHPHRHRGHVHHAHPYGVHPRTSGSSTPAAAPQPSSSGTHNCRWKGCSLSFDTSAELMTHLSLEHVGSGKASYGCEWEGCERASDAEGGGRGFAQRQKVMRHLQTHTGDRPFVCEICNKSFSEAMTLTQHMRVHTNERPYKCTYEGCEKAFSLASALTIHLRTHTGAKPFHCPYPGCTSAFSESSNLSKHVRTHKGEKSYACDECGKAFSRSDQLARHKRIHSKARGEEVS